MTKKDNFKLAVVDERIFVPWRALITIALHMRIDGYLARKIARACLRAMK